MDEQPTWKLTLILPAYSHESLFTKKPAFIVALFIDNIDASENIHTSHTDTIHYSYQRQFLLII